MVVIIALILILGTAGLILGLVLSADDGQQKDENSYSTKDFLMNGEVTINGCLSVGPKHKYCNNVKVF